jgi:CRP-like cAMP-binding protein
MTHAFMTTHPHPAHPWIVFPASEESAGRAERMSGFRPFRALGRSELLEIASFCDEVQVSTGTVLMESGERADFTYLVEAGVIRVLHPGISDVHVTRAERGSVVGWSAVTEPFTVIASAVVVEGCELIRIPAVPLRAFMESHPRAGLDVMREITRLVAERYQAALRLVEHEQQDVDVPRAV